MAAAAPARRAEAPAAIPDRRPRPVAAGAPASAPARVRAFKTPRPARIGDAMSDRLKQALSAPLALLLLIYDALDAVFGPLARPVVAYFARLALFRRIGAAIAALPPYGVLALFAVPFAVIEPFKFLALYWLATGHAAIGVVAFVASHLMSLLVCERIFHAGKARLLEIGWFAWIYGHVARLRERALAWLRATAAWRFAAGVAARVRAAVGRALRA